MRKVWYFQILWDSASERLHTSFWISTQKSVEFVWRSTNRKIESQLLDKTWISNKMWTAVRSGMQSRQAMMTHPQVLVHVWAVACAYVATKLVAGWLTNLSLPTLSLSFVLCDLVWQQVSFTIQIAQNSCWISIKLWWTATCASGKNGFNWHGTVQYSLHPCKNM